MTPQPIRIKRPARHAHRAAFTLLEVLLVLGIIVVIAAMVVPQLMGRGQEANRRAARGSVQSFEKAIEFYAEAENNSEYPQGDTNTVVNLLMNPPQRQDGTKPKPYLTKVPKDPWKRELKYVYDSNKAKPLIYSFGPDGQDNNGGGDDISNTEQQETL